jgi:hypothetical protein
MVRSNLEYHLEDGSVISTEAEHIPSLVSSTYLNTYVLVNKRNTMMSFLGIHEYTW